MSIDTSALVLPRPYRLRPLPLDSAVRPTVSVFVTCYGYGSFLPGCVESVLSQEGVDVEVIVFDDASPDDSAEVASALAARDPRVRAVLHDTNQGMIATANEALDLVGGDYVVKLDADDLLTPGSLARAVALMEAVPQVGFTYGRPVHFSDQPPSARTTLRSWKIWPGSAWIERAARRGSNCISQPEVVMRASALDAAGHYRPELPHTSDFEMFMRLAAISDVGHLVGPDQGLYRVHSASMQRTVNAGIVRDLGGRRDAFESFFAGAGSLVPGSALLAQTARRKMAMQALEQACRAYERGRAANDVVDGLVHFALEVDPSIVDHRLWRAVQRRQRIGAERCRRLPPMIAREPPCGALTKRSSGRAGAGQGSEVSGSEVSAEVPSLGRQMRTGALWGGLSAMVLRIASFLTGVLVARLVAPDEFGVFTVALTVHAVVVNISELGVGSYLVRHEGRPDRVAPTVAAIALISSTILALGMIGVAPAVADALGSPAATGSVRVLALTVLLAGYSVVPNALLIREFRQDKRVLVEIAHFVAATSVLLGLAAAGSGVYALAWSRVAGQLVAVLLLLRLSPTGHRPHLDRSIVRSVLGFGAPLAAANLVGFTVLNLDFIIVGAVLGAIPLGLYTLAFNVSGWPSSVLNSMVNSVALPAIARVQHDRARLSERIASLVGALAAVALPVSALILALAEPVVVSVYGARWSGAAVALGALAAFGAIKVLNDLCANVLVGIGRPRALFGVQVLWLAALLPALLIGVNRSGIRGAGLAHVVVAAAVVLPAYLVLLTRSTGVRLRQLGGAVALPAGAAVSAGLVARLVADRVGSPWGALFCGGAAGLGTYMILALPWCRTRLAEAKALWRVDGVDQDPPAETAVVMAGGAP